MFCRKNAFGIALGITMMLLVVLTLIVSAFFQAYRSHFSLTRSSNSSEAALNAGESVYEYVVFRLEHDRTWGSLPFEAEDTAKDPTSPLITFESEEGSHRFSGRIESLDATFEGVIYNNIAGSTSTEVTTVAGLGTALCQVTCKSGQSTKRAEFLVKVAPLFDSSVLSRADIRVDSETLRMRSNDTDRNFLRSEGDIYVPDMLDGAQTQFLQPNGGPDTNGMLWAKEDIYSYSSSGSATKLELGEDFARASETSHGKMVSGADSHFSVFDMSEEQLKIPDTHIAVSVPAGRWTFVRRPASVTYTAGYSDDDEISTTTGTLNLWVDVLEYYADPDATVPTNIYRAADRTEDLAGQIPHEVDNDDVEGYLVTDSIETDGVVIPGFPNVEVLEGNTLSYGGNSGANFTFDLANQKVTASHNAVVDVKGPFHLTSNPNSGSPTPTPPPVLDLGFQANSSIDGGVSKTAIKATGTISIEDGVTQGLGTLISTKGDVKIQPKNSNSVLVDAGVDGLAGSGLVVFAGNDVLLENPNNTQHWEFKGLVYARGNIKMNGSGAESATFTGSLVALDDASIPNPDPDAPGGVLFSNCGNVEFIYDSKLLDAYVQTLPGDRIQVETAFWRD